MVALVATVVIGGIYFYSRADEHIRAFVEQRLDNHYRHQRVSIRSAQRVSHRQIALRGIVIADPNVEAENEPVVSIDEMLVKCNTGIDDVVQARFNVERITLRGITVRVEQREDGTLSILNLIPLPKFGAVRPLTIIENGTLNFVDRRRHTSRPLVLKDIGFQISEQPDRQGKGKLVVIRGKMSGNELQPSEFDLRIDLATGSWSARGSLRGLLISPELRELLPLETSEKLQLLGSLRCRANLDIQVSSDSQQPVGRKKILGNRFQKSAPNIRYSIDGKVMEGYFSDQRLPFPLTQLTAQVHCNEHGLTIDELNAQCGLTTLRASIRKEGHAENDPWFVCMEAEKVHLNQYASQLHLLNDSLRSKWQTYRPAGVVSVNLDLRSTSEGWERDIEIRCHNVSLTCPKYPYRFHRGQGTLHWKQNQLDVHLKALASGQRVRIDGQILNPGEKDKAKGKIELHSEDPIPVNKTFYDALGEKQSIVTALNAKGSFMIDATVERQSPDEPWHQHILFHLEHCFIQHEACPYPLDKVRGTMEFVDGEWNYRDLVGYNDGGHVTCQGTWRRAAAGGILDLRFEGFNIPIEHELRDALKPSVRQMWDALRARGTMDHVIVDLTKVTGTQEARQPPDIRVSMEKRTTARNEVGQSISIHPAWFPYPLDEFTGRVEYEHGQVTLSKLQARHGPVSIATEGRCQFGPSGDWQCDFHDLAVDHLRLDRAITDALPPSLRRAVAALNPRGAMTLSGRIGFNGGIQKPVASNWDIQLGMHDASVHRGVHFEHIFGTVRFIGQSDGVRLHSQGELDLASMMHRQFQFTQVRGPLWIDNSRLLVGRWDDSVKPGELPRQLTAQVLGGTLYGNGEFPFDALKPFTINASYSGGDLTQISSAVTQKASSLSGKVFARLELQGTGEGLHTLNGSGSIRLGDADIYKLPLMVSLLKIVKIRPPDRTAFTTSKIQFRILGDQVFFDSIDFHGDAISLKGTGNLKFAGDLDLNFYTKIGREKLKIPAVIRPVLREASRQFMLIRVGGTFDDPQPVREVLPGLNETIQQLFPEEVRKSDRGSWQIPRLRSLLPSNQKNRR